VTTCIICGDFRQKLLDDEKFCKTCALGTVIPSLYRTGQRPRALALKQKVEATTPQPKTYKVIAINTY
jgi:uncharacterized membrane protein